MGSRHRILTLALAAGLAIGCHAQTSAAQAAVRPRTSQANGLIQKLPLNEFATYSIGISPDIPTTVMLPAAPRSFEGVGFTTSSTTAAPVYLDYTPRANWFSVRALFPDAEADLNVVIDGALYSFHFYITDTPHRTVTLFKPSPAAKKRRKTSGITVERLFEILDTTKSYLAVREQYPDLYRPIEFDAPGYITPYDDFQIITDQIYRYAADDTIVFRIIFNNRSTQPLRYNPKVIGARVRNSPVLYWSSISDLSGVVPPATVVTAPDGTSTLRPGQSFGYFAITGNPDGTRANVSLANKFDIIIRRNAEYESSAPPSPSPSGEGNPPASPGGALRAQAFGPADGGLPARSAASNPAPFQP